MIMARDGGMSMGEVTIHEFLTNKRIESRPFVYSWLFIRGRLPTSSNIHLEHPRHKLVDEKRRQEEHGMDGRA